MAFFSLGQPAGVPPAAWSEERALRTMQPEGSQRVPDGHGYTTRVVEPAATDDVMAGWDRSLLCQGPVASATPQPSADGTGLSPPETGPESNFSPIMLFALFALADSILMHFSILVHPKLFQSLSTRPIVDLGRSAILGLRGFTLLHSW
uniref:Uncharacterized protein n=1 Tax=Ananas comosus var. bracteatus TaxID=296719 RepID=A0A6V7Q6I2_ANACO|nr:unnamed protein product [Ananas comosus var. bracteatus]